MGEISEISGWGAYTIVREEEHPMKRCIKRYGYNIHITVSPVEPAAFPETSQFHAMLFRLLPHQDSIL